MKVLPDPSLHLWQRNVRNLKSKWIGRLCILWSLLPSAIAIRGARSELHLSVLSITSLWIVPSKCAMQTQRATTSPFDVSESTNMDGGRSWKISVLFIMRYHWHALMWYSSRVLSYLIPSNSIPTVDLYASSWNQTSRRVKMQRLVETDHSRDHWTHRPTSISATLQCRGSSKIIIWEDAAATSSWRLSSPLSRQLKSHAKPLNIPQSIPIIKEFDTDGMVDWRSQRWELSKSLHCRGTLPTRHCNLDSLSSTNWQSYQLWPDPVACKFVLRRVQISRSVPKTGWHLLSMR